MTQLVLDEPTTTDVAPVRQADVADEADLAEGAKAGPTAPASLRAFRHLLANTLVSGVTSTFLWFAVTFWVFLETRSVVVTGVIGGAFSISSAVFGPFFGTFVDRHRKHTAMVVAAATSVLCFAVATAVFLAVGTDELLRLTNPWFWLLVACTLLGSVAGQMRGIALSTCVTLLVPEDRRDRANGMVGTTTGISFALTSVFSGLVVGMLGMGWAFIGAFVLSAVALVHLRTIRIDEPDVVVADGDSGASKFDLRGALDAIRAVPGLKLLILLAAVNNLLAGVFMALMDGYGLSLVSVEAWGLLFGVISLAFIAGGIAVARFGLGRNPLRVVLIGNLVNWAVCCTFALRSSIVLLTFGMAIWLALIPVIEAAEQTVLQRSIPFKRQGRVFGFAQLVENAASPLTAFLVAPLAEVFFMPFMTDGRGAEWIGGWFGTGPERGIALMFTLAGLVGVIATTVARTSNSYRQLSAEPVPAAPAA
ncbi:MAG: MFS transporter [Acidimicrobiia bacterium]|nr:MFS transporter [Acidimicrobiia bacterium]